MTSPPSPPASCTRCRASLPDAAAGCASCAAEVTGIATRPRHVAAAFHPEPAQRRVGEFELLRLLGRGGMGAVWEAQQPSMHRRVALKLLELGVLTDNDASRRFEREAWIGGSLSHPGIVKVFEQGMERDCRWLSMELVEGGSLHAALNEERERLAAGTSSGSAARRDRVRHIVRLFVGTADAVQHVHERAVIHRDIKPLNLLLSGDGSRLLLTDFGLAREEDASRLTQKGDFLGTLRYMSPEQLLAHRATVDHRTDIWSLGVTLYEALTLRLPHEAKTDEGYVSAISQQDPIPARRRSPELPRELETVLAKCLERDPARRYATAGELRDDLTRWLEDRPVLARRPGPGLSALRFVRRHRTPLMAATVAAVVVAGIGHSATRIARDRRDATGIRAFLEQVIRTGVPPAQADPNWRELAPRLAEIVAADPHGDLAILSARASAGPRVSLERSVGLVAAPPLLWVDAAPLLPGASRLAHAVVVEGSLDGGAWAALNSALFRPTIRGSSSRCAVNLADLPVFHPLGASAHRLALRAHILVVPAEILRIAGLASSRSTFCGPGLLDTLWPRLRSVALSEEVRELGTLPLALYDAYPDGFPRRLASGDLARPPSDWFGANVVTLAVERTPKDGRRRLLLALDETGAKSYTAPNLQVTIAEHVAPGSLVVVGIALHGAFDHETGGVSLAGRASLRDATGRDVLSFDVVFGHVAAVVASGDARMAPVPVASVGGQTAGLRQDADSIVGAFADDLQVLPETITSTGILTIVPDIALARVHGCDPIVGEPVSLPVKIRIRESRASLSSRLSRASATP